MVQLDYRDCLYINNIIYHINAVDDFDTMRRELLAMIQSLIPCKVIAFYLSDPTQKHRTANPIGIGVSQEELDTYPSELEDDDYMNIFLHSESSSRILRHSSLYAPGIREKTKFYQRFYEPQQLHYAMTTALFHNHNYIGAIAQYRKKNDPDFSEREITILEMLKDHIALRGFKNMKEEEVFIDEKKRKLEKLMEKYNLSEREKVILIFLSEGSSVEHISEQLFIAKSTTKRHISNIYSKLNINSRIELFKIIP